jgi:hypothetical protein
MMTGVRATVGVNHTRTAGSSRTLTTVNAVTAAIVPASILER